MYIFNGTESYMFENDLHLFANTSTARDGQECMALDVMNVEGINTHHTIWID